MKNKTTQGLGNANLFSFPKHDSLKYLRLKSNVNSHMSIQYYVNQSASHYLGHFPISREENAWCLPTSYPGPTHIRISGGQALGTRLGVSNGSTVCADKMKL
jgi:hypothetical protein